MIEGSQTLKMYGQRPSIDVGPTSRGSVSPNIPLTADISDWKLSVESAGDASTHNSRTSTSPASVPVSASIPKADLIQDFVASGHAGDSNSAARRASIDEADRSLLDVEDVDEDEPELLGELTFRKSRRGCFERRKCIRSSLEG